MINFCKFQNCLVLINLQEKMHSSIFSFFNIIFLFFIHELASHNIIFPLSVPSIKKLPKVLISKQFTESWSLIVLILLFDFIELFILLLLFSLISSQSIKGVFNSLIFLVLL